MFDGLIEPRPDPDLAPERALWDDGAGSGPRTLPPGTWASLTLEFPEPLDPDRARAFFCTGTPGSSTARWRSSVWTIVGMEAARPARDCDSVDNRQTQP